jgi:hypothetical protein
MTDHATALTRYLYFKDEVECSLLFAILSGQIDEALFWAYELYHTGFAIDTLAILEKIYFDFYRLKNPKLETFLKKTTSKWVLNPSSEGPIGTIVRNMVGRDFGTLDQTYFPSKDDRFYIAITETDAEKYQTIEKPEASGEQSTNILFCLPRFSTHKEKLALYYSWKKSVLRFRNVQIPPIFDAQYWHTKYLIYRNEWLYYSAFSPIWQERIRAFSGQICHNMRCVTFPDGSDEEDTEFEFHGLYNCNTDELSTEISGLRAVLPNSPLIHQVDWNSIF